MGIESNKEAYQMVKNTLGSIENRFREAYNKGYKDGLRDGTSQAIAKLVSKVLEETEVDTSQTEETCERCVYVRGSQWCQGCNGTPKRWDGEKIVDTPQTDCGWGKPTTVSHSKDKED